jgi:hypothetical protein
MGAPIVFYQYDEKIKPAVTGDCIGTQPEMRWPLSPWQVA